MNQRFVKFELGVFLVDWPQIYVVVEQFLAENITLLRGYLGKEKSLNAGNTIKSGTSQVGVISKAQ